MPFLKSLLLLMLLGWGSLHGAQKLHDLERCLDDCWGIDRHTIAFIINYFSPYENELIIDDFIQKSRKMQIQFPANKSLQALSPQDGVIQATQYHTVVFENPYIRILLGSAGPGEREPFHSHVWKSLLVVFEEAHYDIESGQDVHEILILYPGVYELPPEDLYACTNVGITKENCLRFEVKD